MPFKPVRFPTLATAGLTGGCELASDVGGLKISRKSSLVFRKFLGRKAFVDCHLTGDQLKAVSRNTF